MRVYIAVAMVLSNWHNVLRAVQMASSECIGMGDRRRFSYCGMLTDLFLQ